MKLILFSFVLVLFLAGCQNKGENKPESTGDKKTDTNKIHTQKENEPENTQSKQPSEELWSSNNLKLIGTWYKDNEEYFTLNPGGVGTTPNYYNKSETHPLKWKTDNKVLQWIRTTKERTDTFYFNIIELTDKEFTTRMAANEKGEEKGFRYQKTTKMIKK
jgi:hypothetical protein